EPLALEPRNVLERLRHQRRLEGRRAELADEAGGLAGGGGVELVALDDDHVTHARPCEMPCRGAPEDATADDGDAGAPLRACPTGGRACPTGGRACPTGGRACPTGCRAHAARAVTRRG